MTPKLVKWVSGRLEAVPAATLFILYHASVGEFPGMGAELICKVPVAETGEARSSLEGESERIATELDTHAREHAEAFGTTQRYKVSAEAAGEVIAQTAFAAGVGIIRGAPTGETMAMGFSEPPTERGLLSHMMRHNETIMGKLVEAVSAMSQLSQPLVSENTSLRKRIESIEAHHLESIKVHEEMLSRKQERDLEFRVVEEGEERRKKFTTSLTDKWIPEILRQIAASGAPQLEQGKNGAPKPGQNGAGITVEGCQAGLRAVFKRIDRGPVFECLDDEHRGKLDNLMGLGTDPPDVGTFRGWLIEVWQQLPEEVSNGIAEKLFGTPEASLFAQFLGAEMPAAEIPAASAQEAAS